MTENQSTNDTKYSLSPPNLENPSKARDFLILLTGTNKKVLELGPASSYLSKILKDQGCHVTGIEVDPDLAKKAEPFLDRIIVGDIEELNLKEVLGTEKYDVILIGDFLEYLKNPNKLLQNLRDFLSRDGYLVCSISNIAHGSIRIKMLNGEFRYRTTGLLGNTHLRFFTLDSILSMLQACGYSMIELKRVKEDIFGADGADLKPYAIPEELLESILRDPESATYQYVFTAIPDQDNKNNLKWPEEFPRYYTIDDLKNRIDDLKNRIDDLKNSTFDPNERAALQQENASLQKMILNIHQSFVFRMLRKYDNIIGKYLPLRPKKYLKSANNYSPKHVQVTYVQKATMNIPLTKKDIICFPIINWNYRYQRPQHMLSKFAQNGHRVFYFTTTLRKLNDEYEIKPLANDIYQIELNFQKHFDIYKDKFSEQDLKQLIQCFNKLKTDLNIDAFCIIQFPTWASLALRLKELYGFKIVFDFLDEFTTFPNIANERKKEEKILLEKSDLVVSVSSHILKKALKLSKNVALIPNAGEFEHFKSTTGHALDNIPKPIVGYFGSIAEWFDTELIQFLASSRPDLNFVFIGYTYGSDIRKLQKFNNVHFLGERLYSELPKYLYSFDVCIIPFRTMILIEAAHPVKIYEYLASGKPVVSSHLPELIPIKDLCYIAEDKEDFLEKLDTALNESDSGLRQQRINFASKNTWNHRFEVLYSELSKISSLNLLHHN